MRRILPILLIFIMVIALSGCTGSNPGDLGRDGTQGIEHENPNLDASIVDVKISPAGVRAGEKVTAKLVIANSGTEDIINETIEIKAKVKTLDDFFANLALKAMSDAAKTRTFTMDFNEEIKPGMIKPLVATFQTQKELQGRSLAGTYEVTVIVSVNGQKVVSKALPITLRPGKPGDNASNTDNGNATPVPTVTATATPTVTLTPEVTETPTPTPTPAPVTVDTPTGVVVPARIMAYKFTVPDLSINAGDEVMWDNFDEDTFTLVDMDGKIPNITVSNKYFRVFNTTGKYRFGLYYKNMRGDLNIQTITVKLNTSQ